MLAIEKINKELIINNPKIIWLGFYTETTKKYFYPMILEKKSQIVYRRKKFIKNLEKAHNIKIALHIWTLQTKEAIKIKEQDPINTFLVPILI